MFIWVSLTNWVCLDKTWISDEQGFSDEQFSGMVSSLEIYCMFHVCVWSG